MFLYTTKELDSKRIFIATEYSSCLCCKTKYFSLFIFLFLHLCPSCPYSGFSNNLIQDIIYSYLVLPNRITIPLVGVEDLAKLQFPMPKVLKQVILQKSVLDLALP